MVLAWSLTVFASDRAHAQNAGARPASLPSSSPRVGVLDGVRGVASSSDCSRDYALKATRGAVRLLRRDVELPVTPRDSAVVADRLRIRRFTDLRFHVDGQRFGTGNFILSPEFGRCTQVAESLRRVGIAGGSGDGSYQLSSRIERSGSNQVERLLLSIENGGATVEWAKGTGALSVIALGREIPVTGTVFTVLVDSARNRGLLYVREGTVTLSGGTVVHAVQGSAVVFDRNGAAQPVKLGDDVLNDVTYYHRTVWTQPYKSGFPYWRVVGGAALGSSAAYLIWHRTRSSKPGAFDGTINVTVPL